MALLLLLRAHVFQLFRLEPDLRHARRIVEHLELGLVLFFEHRHERVGAHLGLGIQRRRATDQSGASVRCTATALHALIKRAGRCHFKHADTATAGFCARVVLKSHLLAEQVFLGLFGGRSGRGGGRGRGADGRRHWRAVHPVETLAVGFAAIEEHGSTQGTRGNRVRMSEF